MTGPEVRVSADGRTLAWRWPGRAEWSTASQRGGVTASVGDPVVTGWRGYTPALVPQDPPVLILAGTLPMARTAAYALELPRRAWQYLLEPRDLTGRRTARVHLGDRWREHPQLGPLLEALAALDGRRPSGGAVEWWGCDPPEGWPQPPELLAWWAQQETRRTREAAR